MALVNVDWATSYDRAKMAGADGKIASVMIDLQKRHDPSVQIIPMIKANHGDQMRVVAGTGLPTAENTLDDEGPKSSKPQSDVMYFQSSTVSTAYVLPENVSSLYGSKAAMKKWYDSQAMNALSNKMFQNDYYGNFAEDRRNTTGFMYYLNDKTAKNKDLILNGGGTGSGLSSIYGFRFHPNTVGGFYADREGFNTGIRKIYWDKEYDPTAPTPAGVKEGVRSIDSCLLQWNRGIYVADWGYAGRIANIPESTVLSDLSGTTTNIISLITELDGMMDADTPGAQTYFFCSKKVYVALRKQAVQLLKGSTLEYENIFGHGRQVAFDGVGGISPIQWNNSFTGTEAEVTGF